MSEPSSAIVEGCHHTGDDLDLSGTDLWGLALGQRAFEGRRLVVVSARRDGAALGLAPARVPKCPSWPSNAV